MPRLLPHPAATAAGRATLAALVLGLVLVAVRLDEVPVGAVTDDAYYVEMARSTAEGRGPVIHLGPGTDAIRPDIFPVGFPLLLAPFAAARPDSLGILKVVPVAAAIGLVLLAWWWPPAGTPRGLRMALVAVLALNPWLDGWAGRILADLPYAALALAALLVAARALEDRRPAAFFAAGLLAGAAVAVRTVGWAGVLAVAAVLVSERRWRELAWCAAGTATVLAPVWLLTGTGPVSAAYADQVGGPTGAASLVFALRNAGLYVAELPVVLVPVFGAPVTSLFTRLGLAGGAAVLAFATGAGLLVLAALATARGWRDGQARPRTRLAFFFVLFTMAALVNFHGYPMAVQARLLLPLLPVLAWLVLAGAWPRPRLAALVLAAMVVAALGHDAWRVARPLGRTTNADGTGLVDPGAGAALVRSLTAPDDLVMTGDPLQRHIHLRRPVVDLPPADADPVAAARDAGAAVVLVGPAIHGRPRVLDERGRRHLGRALARPDALAPALLDSAAAVFVFRVRPPAPPGP